MIRTSAVPYGTKPYEWNISSVYQCTWYAYYRALEEGMSPPTWWDRETETGSYPNAKLWLDNYRGPWIPITDKNYVPVAGDIVVFDGEYGHVQYMETNVMYSEYRNGFPDSFANGKFERTGNLLGFLHYPYKEIGPVDRNTNVTQIQTTDESLRIRTEPSLDAEVIGHVQLGYYNVLQERENEGYTWYEIGMNRWCANVSTVYLPKQDDIIAQIEKYFDAMKTEIDALSNERDQLKKKIEQIKAICES